MFRFQPLRIGLGPIALCQPRYAFRTGSGRRVARVLPRTGGNRLVHGRGGLDAHASSRRRQTGNDGDGGSAGWEENDLVLPAEAKKIEAAGLNQYKKVLVLQGTKVTENKIIS